MIPLSTFQARLQDDLRGIIEGDVDCDELTLQLYSTDASMFESRPLGVIWPRSTDDVAAAVRYAGEKQIPIIARGSGTGAVGGAIGPGLILDFTRYMRRVPHTDEETATVYPGAVRERVNILLRRTKKRFFAPSSGHFPTSTLGSILATDCVGPRWLKHGFPHDYIKELEIVTPDGKTRVLKPEKVRFEPDGRVVPVRANPGAKSLLDEDDGLWRELLRIVRANRQHIKLEQPDGMPDCSGYNLAGVLRQDTFDPTRLIAGSEGTLGIITRATVGTFPQTVCSGAILFLYDSLDKAARSVPSILKSNPTLCDMMDRRIINMVCEWDNRFTLILPPDAEVAVVVELEAESAGELNDRMNQLANRIRRVEKLSFGSWFAFHQVEKDMFRDLLRKGKGTLLRIRHSYQIISLLEDVRVPVNDLSRFMVATQNILKKHGVTYSISGHVGHGQIRIQPILDPSQGDFQKIVLPLAEEIYDEVFRLGGTVGCAQGNGRARSWPLVRRYPKLSAAFVEIKNLFDPNNIFNPEVIVTNRMRNAVADGRSLATGAKGGASDGVPGSVTGNSTGNAADDSPWSVPFRTRSAPERKEPSGRPVLRRQLEVQLKWEPATVSKTTFQCTGCGLCLVRTQETRMCPVFRTLPTENSTCRAKPNLLRGILDGTISLETLTEEETYKIANGCVFCHCCARECPAQTDIPELVFRIKSAYNASHGMTMRDQILSNSALFHRFTALFTNRVSRTLSYGLSDWVLRSVLSIPRSLKLPNRVPNKYTGWRKEYAQPARGSRMKAAIFMDHYADRYDDALVEAAVRVLRHNDIDVWIPPRQRESGHDAFAFGNGDLAESFVRRNVNVFAEAVRQRYKIVTLEPVSAVSLSREYSYVRDDDETKAVAENTIDLCDFLFRLHQDGKLKLEFKTIHQTIGYHAPCRTLALTGQSVAMATPAQELLHLIPGLNVVRIERGCCGLSGKIGMLRENYKRTLKLAMPPALAFRDSAIAFGATECNSCRYQIEQRTDKQVVHPVTLLAYAYGLVAKCGPLTAK